MPIGESLPPFSLTVSETDEVVVLLRSLIRTAAAEGDGATVRSAAADLLAIRALADDAENQLWEPWFALGLVLSTALFFLVGWVARP